eukprot:jgi/Orpsp1_1/1188121/evm.model.d7180000062592.1
MEQRQNFKLVNDPPLFSGRKKDLEGFLTRVELSIEKWAANLRRNNDPILNSLEDFLRELRRNFGDPELEAVVANGKLDTIRQRKYGHVFEYINEFKRISQNSDFNDAAKIYMFLKGLHPKMREHLAVVNPNPNNLNRLITDKLTIENLTKRNRISEYYLRNRNDPSSSNTRYNDPMDVDLYRIRDSRRDTRYFPSKEKLYTENKNNHEEERKKGLCFLCKKPGHLQFNCPNRKRPRSVKRISKIEENDDKPSASVRRIRKLDDHEDFLKIRKIVDQENAIIKRKNNIIDFYIKTNDTEERRVRVLVDSGSDLNFIHPNFANAAGIKLYNIKKPFHVAGLGEGVSTVNRETEKCILRLKNHREAIQFYVLRIPDVDIILGISWIEKHCPSNYHDARKISFASGYCANHFNNGKHKRRNVNKYKKRKSRKGKEVEEEKAEEEITTTEPRLKYAWESDSESDKEEYVKGRKVRTINDSDSDSDINDYFMLDSDNEYFNENTLIKD